MRKQHPCQVAIFYFATLAGIKAADPHAMNVKFRNFAALGAAALAGVLLMPAPSSGQADGGDAVMSGLLNDLAAEQVTIADNQTKIDAKLAEIAENVRVARIFVSRGGGKVR